MINKLIFSVFIILFIGLAFYSCSNDDNPVASEANEPAIYGKVVDEQGNPVAGVNVHYVPELADTSLEKVIINPLSTYTIKFLLPHDTYVTLVLLEHITRDTLFYVINNELMSAGGHSVVLDVNSLTNGIYHYVIKFDTSIVEKKIILRKDPQELVALDPLTTTDNEGNFRLNYDRLGIGEIFGFSSEVSPGIIYYRVITDSLQIFLTKQNYNDCLEQIKVDTNYTFSKTFTLTK